MDFAELQRLFRAGRFAEALRGVEQILAVNPQDRDALYCGAVAAGYLGQNEEAWRFLESLASHHPSYGRGWQERGHVLRRRGQQREALDSYLQATRKNPALHASWRAIADLGSELGDHENAHRAVQEVTYIETLPRELLSVSSMLYEGRMADAERLCRQFMLANPRNTEGMRLLAEIGTKLGVYDDAETLLATALELRPDFHLARMDYVNVLQRRQKFPDALGQAEILLNVDPGNRFFRMVFASQVANMGDYARAIPLYEALEADGPATALTHLLKGHALKTVGRQIEAIGAYHDAAGARTDFGDAYWSLANLKTYRFTQSELEHMQSAAEASDTAVEDRIHFLFALGKAHEDDGDYERSFNSYNRGNELKKSATRYRPEQIEVEFGAMKELVTAELLQGAARHGCPDPAPIFIVGLPRSGSTLIEQILASHSMVDGTLELPHVLAAVHRLNGRRRVQDQQHYPAILGELAPARVRELGERYILDTRVYRRSAPRFTDKMPNNFRHLGLIAMMLPNATIIDARRNAMDCCFSCFKQLFAEGQEFTYGLDVIGRYYLTYVEIMEFWDRVMPGRILRVQHEDVVADLEGQTRRILEHCGLTFESQCLEFYRSERAVRTASSEQVRQPINRDGVGHWKKFERWLEPLREALGRLADIRP